MAIDIFDQGYSDHVVFDRIVDADRTITLARQAADKAEAAGQLDKAAKLREKADYLEQILHNTQTPDYSDELDGTPPTGGESEIDSASNQVKPETVDKTVTQNPTTNTASTSGTTAENSSAVEEPETKTVTDDTKLPQDIQHIDDHTGSHADGINNQDNGGGAGGSSSASSSSGKSGKSSGGAKDGESDSDETEEDEDEGGGDGDGESANQANGSGKGGQSTSNDVDPFRMSLGGGQGQQLTPEEELEAIIRRLSRLTGDARKGADRGLQDFFNQISGGDSL